MYRVDIFVLVIPTQRISLGIRTRQGKLGLTALTATSLENHAYPRKLFACLLPEKKSVKRLFPNRTRLE